MFSELSAPFPPEAIHWRAQTVKRDGSAALALAYLDARDVMDRLDEVCGPENWRDSYVETAKGRLICTLEIRCFGEWIAKSDGAGESDMEGEKGAISGALKRAAVKWGIGRYLYDLSNVWAPCESYEVDDRGKKRWKWNKWKPESSRVFGDALRALSAPKPEYHKDPVNLDANPEGLVNEGQLRAIRETARKAGVPEATICKNMQVARLDDLLASKYQFVVDKLNITISEKEAA